MQADYHDAHERHWDDAERLLQEQRWANADHLYGLATECGLKRLMLVFGMTMNPAGNAPSDRQDHKHADEIWSRYDAYRSGHNAGAAYALPLPNPFLDWNAAQRYANQRSFDQTRAQAHQGGASDVRKLLKWAQKDGLI